MKAKKNCSKRRFLWAGGLLLMVIVFAIVSAFTQKREPLSAGETVLICQAEYPEMRQRPRDLSLYRNKDVYYILDFARNESIQAQRDQAKGYEHDRDEFFAEFIPRVLSGGTAENQICSPMGAYMALVTLAELAGGDSREQILDCLGAENIEDLRGQANALWNAFYCDDGSSVSLVETSLLINQEMRVKEETLELVAANEYASSYWHGEETEEAFSLRTNVVFRENWLRCFFGESDYSGIFHGASGDQNCEYICLEEPKACHYGKNFAAVTHQFTAGQMNGNIAWFILPKEGVSIAEVLESEEFYPLLQSGFGAEWENQTSYKICLSIPEFEVYSTLDLRGALEEMGVTDVFDGEKADLSPVLKGRRRQAVGTVEQSMSLVVDGKGAYSGGTDPLEEEVYSSLFGCGEREPLEMTFDRPFIFAITGPERLPLFVGIVNQP